MRVQIAGGMPSIPTALYVVAGEQQRHYSGWLGRKALAYRKYL
jgi:hypothetical protein